MKDRVAERVLASVMEWDSPEVAAFGSPLQMLASQKYDSYEGYRPGVKFLEHLSGLLHQFPNLEDRQRVIRFVLEDLVFVSRAEMSHLIETVYPDHIRPLLIKRAAEQLKVSRFAVAEIVRSPEFQRIQRSTLVLGLSDGAHIDQLRRASPELSHEQIFLATDIGDETMRRALTKLRKALPGGSSQFEHVLLVDDFYGSGESLLREEDGQIVGRLTRTQDRLKQLATGMPDPNDNQIGVLSPDCGVSVLVYIASAQAEQHVRKMLAQAGLEWGLSVVQPLPPAITVDDPDLQRICREHYDPALTDNHTKRDVPLGYADCALPLVLEHNTPNNSVCILWGDTTDRPKSRHRRALFPRYARHQEGRN